ncbi:cysteine desulfurase family protein [Candidatus Lokiarchaeum ossiferum]|uniref:cysteine desulfurase family protein n=1 Tax=Candidatus Lokiarchaeum ossiferum TaxID=2951803 RepID=UPI00352D1C83
MTSRDTSQLQKKYVYLDHAATTPMDPDVFKVFTEYSINNFENPSSLHEMGKRARKSVENSRKIIASSLNIHPKGVIFTSSGTESDNLALQGIMRHRAKERPHLIVSQIEHPAIYNTAKYLEHEGFEVSYVPVTSEGFVELSVLESLIQENTQLISIHFVNNEIGTYQPIKEIGQLAKKNNIIFHSDAVQAFGKIPIDMQALNIDLLSLSGHKLYGPKGVGALCINSQKLTSEKFSNLATFLEPMLYGGLQENSLRPSTENVPAIIALGRAVENAEQNMNKWKEQGKKLQEVFINEVLTKIPYSYLNGNQEKRLYNNCNFRFDGVDGFDLLMLLDNQGIATSTGSACSSKSDKPSRVLTSLGLSPSDASGSIRLTLGKGTTAEDIQYTVAKMERALKQLRFATHFQ